MEAGAVEVDGLAGTDEGQAIYQILKNHGLTLEDWADKHPADKRFCRMAAIEEGQRREEQQEEQKRNAG
jgi:hypothetical protein